MTYTCKIHIEGGNTPIGNPIAYEVDKKHRRYTVYTLVSYNRHTIDAIWKDGAVRCRSFITQSEQDAKNNTAVVLA